MGGGARFRRPCLVPRQPRRRGPESTQAPEVLRLSWSSRSWPPRSIPTHSAWWPPSRVVNLAGAP